MAGKMERTGLDDKAHRRRWKARARLRKTRVRKEMAVTGGVTRPLLVGPVATSVQEVRGPSVAIAAVPEGRVARRMELERLISSVPPISFSDLPETVTNAKGNPIPVSSNYRIEKEVELSDQCFINGRRVWCEVCCSDWGVTYDYVSRNPFSGNKPRAKYTWYDCARCTRSCTAKES